MLSPFDDFPIHQTSDPIAHTQSGDANHYDRYFFNGHPFDGSFMLGAAMGHYPNRAVVDGSLSLVIDGLQHSFFASGRMPLDRSTVVGPLRIEVQEPMQRLRFVVEPNETGIEADLVFDATTAAVEEPRQRKAGSDGILFTDHTRMTQFGRWSGHIRVDDRDLAVHDVPGTKDRSWGTRQLGPQPATNRPFELPQVFWLWAPVHWEDGSVTHLGLHEHADGSRWFETAMVVDPLPEGSVPWSTDGIVECSDARYDLRLEPGTRQARTATIGFRHPVEGDVEVELDRIFVFRMRGIGYTHPEFGHGTPHGDLAVGRDEISVEDFDPADLTGLHIQTLMRARAGDRTGIGVLEQVALGDHEPTGLTGIFDGYHPT